MAALLSPSPIASEKCCEELENKKIHETHVVACWYCCCYCMDNNEVSKSEGEFGRGTFPGHDPSPLYLGR